MRRVIEGLNSADPVTRIITFEEAMARGDKNLERIALQKAFTSSDVTLRSTALETVMSTKTTFVMEVATQSNTVQSEQFMASTGGAINVQITDFDKATGDFFMHSNLSRRDRDRETREYSLRRHKANFSGDRISFEINLGSSDLDDTCKGTATLGPSGSALVGTMSCWLSTIGIIDVTIDLVR